jgi:hypothetical protein
VSWQSLKTMMNMSRNRKAEMKMVIFVGWGFASLPRYAARHVLPTDLSWGLFACAFLYTAPLWVLLLHSLTLTLVFWTTKFMVKPHMIFAIWYCFVLPRRFHFRRTLLP